MATLSERDWGLIIERIRTGQCAVFLGAGASAGGPGGSGIPTASEIAEYLAVAATDPKDHYGGPQKYDLLRMAQYLESVEDRKFLCDKIIDKINNPKFAPGAVHRDLAALPFSFYLTTNFDTLMEKALEEQSLPKQVLKKRPNTACYDRFSFEDPTTKIDRPCLETPLVYKLHGTIKDWDSLIVTEHDVVEFMACVLNERPSLPLMIRNLFQTHSFLFIGYGLKDWNVRLLLQAIRSGPKGRIPNAKSYAVQLRPQDVWDGKEWDTGIHYWNTRGNLVCYSLSGAEFTGELRHRFEKLFPP